MLTLYDRSWPMTRLVMDAKYRIEAASQYVDRYRSPGPPEDALNVLHRYRDAIIEGDPQASDLRPKHTVIQAAALFPYREREPGAYRSGRLWRALDLVDTDAPGGRAWLATEAGRARYTGLAGYLFRPSSGDQERYYARSDEAAAALSRRG